MNRKAATLLASFFGMAAMSYSIAARSSETSQQYDPKVLAQVAAFYGISEGAAIVRLDKEYEASVQARRIEELQLPGYAGLWFDAPTLALHVAVSGDADVEAVEELGATPVRVAHALTELDRARENLTDAMDSALGAGVVRESYVDFQANGLVVGVPAENLAQASEFLRAQSDFGVPVQLVTAREDVDFSSNLYGADGTRNHTWEDLYGTSQPCSAGASAERVSGSSYTAGYVTAGHCNSVNRSTGVGDIIHTSGDASLGQAVWSSFDIGPPYKVYNNEDGAWVQTNAGWTPQPKINGYSSGTLTVSATWAGTLEAPVGTTACRYGGTSGGPHCAAISTKNVTACFTGCTITIKGLSKVNGICTNAGDSGGPLITPANQVQGTDTGGTLNSCPDSSTDYVYFQPITTTLNRANSVLGAVAMLTSHGRSAPTFSVMTCPDPGSASGHFICFVGAYDSQGKTTMSWPTNTGKTSTTSTVSGSCAQNQTVIVTLSLANPYGTTTSTKSFLCPWGPPV